MSDHDEAGTPPCFAHDLIGGQPVDAQTAREVARFRRAERERLLALRRALSQTELLRQAEVVATRLDDVVAPRPGQVISVYWPIRAEIDLRGWMRWARETGARVTLPVVVERAAPLIFREWTPGCPMERGIWNIPVPAQGEELTPDVVIAPLVGADAEGYRLGNGGGYYDRTLAEADPRPRRIGVGHDFVRMQTIFPMPWDIPMQSAILGDGSVETFT